MSRTYFDDFVKQNVLRACCSEHPYHYFPIGYSPVWATDNLVSLWRFKLRLSLAFQPMVSQTDA